MRYFLMLFLCGLVGISAYIFSPDESKAQKIYSTASCNLSTAIKTVKFSNLNCREQQLFASYYQQANPKARSFIAQVLPLLTVSINKNVPGGMASYKSNRPGRKYKIELNPRIVSKSSKQTRLLVLHELGHIVDYAGLSQQAADSIFGEFQQSPAWQKCYQAKVRVSWKCVPQQEIFAVQFQNWAGKTTKRDQAYNVPNLVSATKFKALMEEHFQSGNGRYS